MKAFIIQAGGRSAAALVVFVKMSQLRKKEKICYLLGHLFYGVEYTYI